MKIYNDPENTIPSYTYMKDWKKGDKAYYLTVDSGNRLSIYLVTLDNDYIKSNGTEESHVFFIVDKIIVSIGNAFKYKVGEYSGGVWPTSFYYTDNSLFGTKYLTRAFISDLFHAF